MYEGTLQLRNVEMLNFEHPVGARIWNSQWFIEVWKRVAGNGESRNCQSRLNICGYGGKDCQRVVARTPSIESVELERKFDCPFHFLHAWDWKEAQLPCDQGAFDDGYSFSLDHRGRF